MAINTSIVLDKANSVVAEGLKQSLSIPSKAITPSTLMAMAGLAQGGALQIVPKVTDTLTAMRNKAEALVESAPAIASQLLSATNSLQSLTSKMMPPGNPAAFGQIVMQAQGHIADALEMKSAMNFMSTTSFESMGAGIKDMASTVTQGLDTVTGDLGAAANALKAVGPLADLSNPASIGSTAGLAQKLIDSSMGNASGVVPLLTKAGVDVNDLSNPANAAKIDQVMGTIKDPKILNDVANQFDVSPFAGLPSYSGTDSSLNQSGGNLLPGATTPYVGTPGSAVNVTGIFLGITDRTGTPYASVGAMAVLDQFSSAASEVPTGGGGIQSLKDFTDITKMANPADIAGFSGDLKGMATKLSDMGASFPNATTAAAVMASIEVPKIPSLNAIPSMSSLVEGVSDTMSGLMGSGSGFQGLPNMQDFTEAVAGGPKIDEMFSALQSGAIDAIQSAVSGIQDMVSSTTGLMSKAGIDLDIPAPSNLSSIMSFGTGLHKLGVDAAGTGVSDILGKMATPDAFGDAIKSSLIEGKNKAVMAVGNMPPLDFSGVSTSNPFAGLPSDSSNTASADAAALLGGSSPQYQGTPESAALVKGFASGLI